MSRTRYELKPLQDTLLTPFRFVVLKYRHGRQKPEPWAAFRNEGAARAYVRRLEQVEPV